jgi:hypothetical protein
MQYLLDFLHIIPVQAAGLVHTFDNLIHISAYALELGGMFYSFCPYDDILLFTVIKRYGKGGFLALYGVCNGQIVSLHYKAHKRHSVAKRCRNGPMLKALSTTGFSDY